MQRTTLGILTICLAAQLTACGGDDRQSRVKTPQERLDEELAKADGEGDSDYDSYSDEATESEEAKMFDDAQADIELKRASRSATTCPGTLTEEEQKSFKPGTAQLRLTFANDGHVKDSSINAEYQETAVGNCVLRAMGAIIVPAYTGEEKSLDWEIELATPTQEEAKK